MRQPIVQREAVGADDGGQESRAERQRRDQARDRPKRGASDGHRPFFLIDHFDADRHLPDRLSAERREGDEVATVQQHEKREQRNPRKVRQLAGGQPEKAKSEV